MLLKLLPSLLWCLLAASATGQRSVVRGWHLLDREEDGYYGISLDKAYRYLEGRKAVSVVVAVLDGGIDTSHEDLKQKLWKNPREIPNNGLDDDRNGYPDDLNGWNFLGNPSGENVIYESSETARQYHQLKHLFEGKPADTLAMSAELKEQFRLWQEVTKAISVSEADIWLLKLMTRTRETLRDYDSLLRTAMGRDQFNAMELEQFLPGQPEYRKAKFGMLRLYQLMEQEPETSNRDFLKTLEESIRQSEEKVYARERPPENFRLKITGDDENNLINLHYGNNDIMSSSPFHGTHVAGIIGADRHNDTGIQGVADKVQLMSVRMVPDGDEHDKDVALGIRYAVDNGARVINMSFGKRISPQKKWITDAMEYAARKNVLLIKAAGNESVWLDTTRYYPSALLDDGTTLPNVITVGASGDLRMTDGLLASFSNYGVRSVDVLAPGVDMYATAPMGNRYSFQEGTSLAAPVVSGLAAMLMSYFPELSAAEVKQAIESSADRSRADSLVNIPGQQGKKMKLSQSCRTGGIVNAYTAVLAAEAMVQRKMVIPGR